MNLGSKDLFDFITTMTTSSVDMFQIIANISGNGSFNNNFQSFPMPMPPMPSMPVMPFG